MVVFIKKRATILIPVGAIAFQYVVYTAIYSYSVQKLLTASFILIWFWWVSYADCANKKMRQIVTAALCLYLLVIPITYVSDVVKDVRMLYSDAVNAAAFLKENTTPDAVILTPDEGSAGVMIASMPGYTFYKPQTKEQVSFATWSSYSDNISYPEVQIWVEQAFPGKDVYMILSIDYSYIPDLWDYQDRYEILYQTQGESIAMFERYILFKIENKA